MELVKANGYTLKYVKIKHQKFKYGSRQTNAKALRYVKEQTMEICMEAIQQKPYLLEIVDVEFLDDCLNFYKRWKTPIN